MGLLLRCSPSAPFSHGDVDHGSIGWPILVLLVPRDDEVDRSGVSFPRFGDRSCSIGANPPEPSPVIVVVVGQQGHPGIGLDIGQSLESRGALGFVVDDTDDRVAADGANDRYEVGSLWSDRGEVGYRLG